MTPAVINLVGARVEVRRYFSRRLRRLQASCFTGTYAKQFDGAICIQIYDRSDFADRISGVTLDAFMAGSPIMTTAGT